MSTRKQKTIAADAPESSAAQLIGQAILSLVGKVPASKEPRSRKPADDARHKANAAAAKAASGS